MASSVGVDILHTHFEVIMRGCTDQVFVDQETGRGLRSHGHKGEIILEGVARAAVGNPSWLKSLGFGYVKQRLTKAVTHAEVSLGLVTEQIISTKIQHLHKED